MAIFLPDLRTLRGVTWARSYYWDIKCPDAPQPFDKWFPAISVDETVVNLTSYGYSAPYHSFAVPQNSGLLDLRISFPDSEDLVLYKWIKDWVNKDILHFRDSEGSPYLAYVEDIVKEFHIVKYKFLGEYKKDIVSYTVYSVYPENTLSDALTSDSSLRQFSVFFRVCGMERIL